MCIIVGLTQKQWARGSLGNVVAGSAPAVQNSARTGGNVSENKQLNRILLLKILYVTFEQKSLRPCQWKSSSPE